MIEKLKELHKNSYSPYSNYPVSAIVVMKDGKEYTGVNVENASFGATICAERTAFVKAISEGEKDFASIVVVGGPKDGSLEECLPCGYCRQFMNEFVDKDFKILNAYGDKVDEYTINDLLPHGFRS
jgi:cytidine deaminase